MDMEDFIVFMSKELNSYYYIFDSYGNIIYPKNELLVSKIDEILKNKVDKNGLIHTSDNLWDEYKDNKIIKNGGEFNVISLIDVTKYKENEFILEKDETTCLLNKRATFRKIDEYIEGAMLKNVPFSIVIGDIDFFKSFNDVYGHIAGDLVLKKVAEVLFESVKNDARDNILGRFGGEEFIMLFDNMNYNDTVKLVENIKNKIGELSVCHNDKEMKNITMSFGVYYYNTKEKLKSKMKLDIEKIRNSFIECADKALYCSKENGRDRVTVYNELNN